MQTLEKDNNAEGIRHTPGGLDNAVREAQRRGLHKMFIVDTDAHQMEAFSRIVDYLPGPYKRKYGSILPELDPDVEWYRNFHFAGGRIKRTEVSYPNPQEPKELIETFVTRMHEIGIKRSIVFPNQMLALGYGPFATSGKAEKMKGVVKDMNELEVVAANAYMDYMLDQFVGKYPEFLTMIYAPANSPDKAAELIDRVGSEKGVVGVMTTPARPTLAGSDDWNPIYEAAVRKELPLTFHAQGYRGDFLNLFKKYMPAHALNFPFYLAMQLTSLLTEGVPERFPKLKLVFMEGGVSWIPWLMHRLDSLYLIRGAAECPLLRKMPSEYMKQFYYTTQPLDHPKEMWELENTFRIINGENTLLYASDYPHWDWDLPSVIYDLPFLSKAAKEKILGKNAAKVFRIN